MNNIAFVFRSKSSEQEVLDSIKKCTDVMNQSVIEQTAYIRAAAEKKQLDLEKFKDDVRRELNSPNYAKSSKYYFLTEAM